VAGKRLHLVARVRLASTLAQGIGRVGDGDLGRVRVGVRVGFRVRARVRARAIRAGARARARDRVRVRVRG